MKVKQFEDKYDKEFVHLMLEIDKRIENISKSDKLKINSWVNALCIPTNSIPWKKNRNLYTILLLDNILNGKLDEPFNKFLREGDELRVLSPTLIKSKISNKFTTEINFDREDDEIQNFINLNFYNENEFKSPIEITEEYLKQDLTGIKSRKSKKRIENQPLQTHHQKQKRRSQDISNTYAPSNPMPIQVMESLKENRESDNLLKKKYFGIKEKLKNESGFFTKTKPKTNKLEEFKLDSMVAYLQNEIKVKNQIIMQQEEELNELRKKVASEEKRVNTIFAGY